MICFFNNKISPSQKFISFSGQFPNILMRQGGTFFCVCNNQCWFKCSGSFILETTMHAFDINALLTMIAINKLTERIRKWPETDTIFVPQCKNNQCGSKNTHTAVPEKLTINFFWPYVHFIFLLFDRVWSL